MTIKRLLAGTAGLAALALLTGCGGGTTTSTGSADADRLQVVSAVYPYQWLAEEIGGDAVDAELLTQAGGDAHDLELTPRQTAAISQDADLVVFQRTLTPAVDAAVDAGTRGTVLDTGTLVPAAATQDEHADEAPAEGDGHGHDGGDPHVWLDPTTMITIAEAMRDDLARIDPGNAEAYGARTDTVVAELTALDEEYAAGLAQCDVRVFIPSHAAFGHLAERYALEQVAVRGLDSSVEPSAARIAEVQDIARSAGVTTIFYETAVSPAVSESIARDTGLRTDVLDPIAAQATDDSRGTDYPSRMRSNLQALRTANGCR